MAESGTPTPTSLAYGAALRRARKRQKLSLEQVSERLRDAGEPMAPTVLSRTERGRRDLRASEAVALARALRVDPLELLDAGTTEAAVARADEAVSGALERLHESLAGVVAALSQRWAADTETFTAPDVIKVHADVQDESLDAILETLSELGISRAITLCGTGN